MKQAQREPLPTETYQEYLDFHGVRFFSAEELTRHRRWRKHIEPDRTLWSRMIPTVLLADEIRTQLGSPLLVGNGYRSPDYNTFVGGSPRSQHKMNAAIDLDLPRSELGAKNEDEEARLWREFKIEFKKVASLLYKKEGKRLRMGIGLYSSWPRRIHIDTGHRRRFWGPPGFSTYLRNITD